MVGSTAEEERADRIKIVSVCSLNSFEQRIFAAFSEQINAVNVPMS